MKGDWVRCVAVVRTGGNKESQNHKLDSENDCGKDNTNDMGDDNYALGKC